MTCYDCIHCGACSDVGDPGFSSLKEDVSKCKHFKNKADFVEVCRCRDCEYWHKKVFDDIYERYVGECHCPQWENDYLWYETTETDFCSYGKRRDT